MLLPPLVSPLRFLAEEVGKKATVETSRCTSVPTFVEKHRDITSYSKRKGDLPSQKEEDPIDMRAVLHRDGSVISAVTLDELNRPDRLYYNLGCKTAVCEREEGGGVGKEGREIGVPGVKAHP